MKEIEITAESDDEFLARSVIRLAERQRSLAYILLATTLALFSLVLTDKLLLTALEITADVHRAGVADLQRYLLLLGR